MNERKIDRRSFLGAAARSAAALSLFNIVPRHVLGGPGYIAPSETLTRAVIGTGAMGMWHVHQNYGKLLAVCDVDDNHLQEALKAGGPDVKGYRDFREVLAREDIDIVHIPTPPHWHALISIAAAEASKNIWCEKPMTRTIGEGLKVIDAVQRHGRIFRVNVFFRYTSPFYGMETTVKPIKKLVDSGMLGWPLKFTVGAGTGFDWKLHLWEGKTNLAPQQPPENLDYDLWLGPAPYKPYNSERVHQNFRGYWDYDGGGLGDMGQHFFDPIQYLLNKDHTSPVEIEADTPLQHPDAVIAWRRIWMRYEDGCEIVLDAEGKSEGAPFIEGPGGKVYKGFKSDIPNLQKKLAQLPDPEPLLSDFAEAVRTRKKHTINEESAHRSTTLVNLGKIAVRLGRPLRFDPVAQRFIDDEAANRLIDQPMRTPWHL